MDLERRLEQGPLRVAPLWSAGQQEKLPQQVLKRRRQRALVRGGAGVLAALATVAGAWFFSMKSPSEARPSLAAAGMAAGSSQATSRQPREFSLADGSRVSLLGAGSRVDVVEQTPARVRTRLGRRACGGSRKKSPAAGKIDNPSILRQCQFYHSILPAGSDLPCLRR